MSIIRMHLKNGMFATRHDTTWHTSSGQKITETTIGLWKHDGPVPHSPGWIVPRAVKVVEFTPTEWSDLVRAVSDSPVWDAVGWGRELALEYNGKDLYSHIPPYS